jgi:DNA phosphorothioation-dependent restriction protein DptH
MEKTAISLPKDVVFPPLQVPDNFKVWHIAMGCQKIISLFKNEADANHLELPNTVIRIRPENASFFTKNESLDNSLESIEIAEKSNNDQADVETKTEIFASVQTIESKNDEVAIEIKPTETDFKISVGVNNVAPDKILIGTKSNGEGVYWYYGHKDLANRHLLLFGTSGSGKTYGIQCLLAEMAKQGMRSLIVDYTDGFLPQQIETRFCEIANPQNHFVITDKLPLNPFRRQQQIIDPSIPAIEESPYQVATRVSSIFTSVFNTMGDQQSSALIHVLETGIAEDAKFSLSSLLERLRDDSQYGESLANKLAPFIRAEPFREGVDSAWEQMLTSPKHSVHVLQLKGLAREIQKLVTEFALWDLYDYACNTGSKNRPIPIVLDEIQNLDHRSDSPIDKMLREGRKFGLSLILATQTTSQFDQEQRDRLFQAGHKLFFKPADTEIDRFAALLSLSTNESKAIWAERLAKLQKGQCWSLGPVLTSGGSLQTKAVLVSVTALEDRDFKG